MNFFALFYYVHDVYIWSFDCFPYISYGYIVLLIYLVIVWYNNSSTLSSQSLMFYSILNLFYWQGFPLFLFDLLSLLFPKFQCDTLHYFLLLNFFFTLFIHILILFSYIIIGFTPGLIFVFFDFVKYICNDFFEVLFGM